MLLMGESTIFEWPCSSSQTVYLPEAIFCWNAAFFIMLTPLPADSQRQQMLGTSTLFGGFPAREPTRNVGHFIEKPWKLYLQPNLFLYCPFCFHRGCDRLCSHRGWFDKHLFWLKLQNPWFSKNFKDNLIHYSLELNPYVWCSHCNCSPCLMVKKKIIAPLLLDLVWVNPDKPKKKTNQKWIDGEIVWLFQWNSSVSRSSQVC